jgi:hypothetical protein
MTAADLLRAAGPRGHLGHKCGGYKAADAARRNAFLAVHDGLEMDIGLDGNPQLLYEMTHMERDCVVILGMHRSGTSALTGVLQQLGVDFGDDLIGATPANPKGHFELTSAVRMNDHLLRRIFGVRWKTPFLLPDHWRKLVDVEEVAREYALRLPGGQLCGLKDPRICRLVPIWRELLSRRGLRPKFLLMLRKPEEVVASLQARDEMAREDVRALWVEHVCAAERDTRNVGRLIVTYEELLENTSGVTRKLAAFLGLPTPDLSRSDAVLQFLDRGLRHHVGEASERNARCDTADCLYNLAVNGCEAEFSTAVDEVFAERTTGAI